MVLIDGWFKEAQPSVGGTILRLVVLDIRRKATEHEPVNNIPSWVLL